MNEALIGEVFGKRERIRNYLPEIEIENEMLKMNA